MLNSYIYIFVEMLMIILGMYCLNTIKKYGPGKIKLVVTVILVLEVFRLISNLIMFVSDSILFLYILKFFALVNIATIPITGIICVYIFIRSENINFDNIFMAGAILLVAYSITVFNVEYSVQRTIDFGYLITLRQWVYVELAFVAVISVILIWAMLVVGKKVSNNTGLIFVIIASMLTIGEITMKIFGLQVMPNLFFADFIWIMVLMYAISTIRTNKGR